MNKRIIAWILTLSMLLCFLPGLSPQASAADDEDYGKNPFTDVKSDRFEAAILWAYYNNITTGTGDGSTFSPEGTCTRKQIVTFLWRAAGEPEPKSTVNPFTDVKADRFEKAILWAYYEGITTGTGDGSTFSPENKCTRKQIVTFLWRFHGEPEPASTNNTFTDVKADRFEKAILWAFYEGITSGTGDGTTFSPENPCTRKQIVTFLYRDRDNLQANNELTYAEGTVLRMATGYNSARTGLFFDAYTTGDGIPLADGKYYRAGDLKPTWVEVQNRLGVLFENKYTGNSATNEFRYWEERLNEVDVVFGTVAQLTEAGTNGKLINLEDYLDVMPNFRAFLEENPIIRLSITADMDKGGIYNTPFMDGMNDIQRMPLMRTDWVEKLLNGGGAFTAEASNAVVAGIYTPYMPTSGKVNVDVVTLDGNGIETITKDYDAAGNIVEVMNTVDALDGVTAVNLLRTYIDTAYNGYYGTNRANLFIGQNAAWDADELVALLRCIVANPQTLNGTDHIEGIFSRDDSNNQRRVDMYRLAGILFGVRGLESQVDYLYVGADGLLHDARQEEATYESLERMNAMAQEGLISLSFLNMTSENSSSMLEYDLGFMSYDFVQSQTMYNSKLQDGEEYTAVMIPVAHWYDGSTENGVYMRFTESWRNVSSANGWAISAAGVADNQDKLNAALKLFDFFYSEEGMILMTYGPDAFIKTNADGSYVTFNFNGQQMPVISDATYAEIYEKCGGNYTNYTRMYLGSNLSFVKCQAYEFQTMDKVGQKGAGYISNAISLGTVKHLSYDLSDNLWYTCVPVVLPNTTEELAIISRYTDLANSFSTAKGKINILIDQIVAGYTMDGMASAEETVNYVSNVWNGSQYITLKNDAWKRLVAFYESLK